MCLNSSRKSKLKLLQKERNKEKKRKKNTHDLMNEMRSSVTFRKLLTSMTLYKQKIWKPGISVVTNDDDDYDDADEVVYYYSFDHSYHNEFTVIDQLEMYIVQPYFVMNIPKPFDVSGVYLYSYIFL